MKNYTTIIYDIDGTILNTLDMNMYPLIRIIEEETGEQWTFDQVLRFAAYPGRKVIEELKIQNVDAVYQRWVSYVNAYEDGARLYEGFPFLFDRFQAHGIQQAVVSSKTKKQYALDFVAKGLDSYMSVAILAEDTKNHKPHPDPLLACLKALNLKPEETIYIGDAQSDYEAAMHAGIDFGYAKWGSVSDHGILFPTFTFEQPHDLLELLSDSIHSTQEDCMR
ncbi:HAD family hydrolase [Enterococcus sp. LJL98]